MNGRMIVLKSDIQAELAIIERIFAALPTSENDLANVKETIVTGYYLHNLYNAFENIFRLVTEAFENHIPDPSRWHSLLLERMGRDIEGVRPRMLGDTALESLDELRRFRHLFRHLYRNDLDPDGVRKALEQAHRLQHVYEDDIDRFFAFLDNLSPHLDHNGVA